jgi:hypothetical protein
MACPFDSHTIESELEQAPKLIGLISTGSPADEKTEYNKKTRYDYT